MPHADMDCMLSSLFVATDSDGSFQCTSILCDTTTRPSEYTSNRGLQITSTEWGSLMPGLLDNICKDRMTFFCSVVVLSIYSKTETHAPTHPPHTHTHTHTHTYTRPHLQTHPQPHTRAHTHAAQRVILKLESKNKRISFFRFIF